MIDERKHRLLPVAIEGITDRTKNDGNYALTEEEKEKVIEFYKGLGFIGVTVQRTEWTDGIRDLVWATLPDGWYVIYVGGGWCDYMDEKWNKRLEVYRKFTADEYCFFARVINKG